MNLAGCGVAQIVVRRLAVRQARLRISVRQPSVVDPDLLVGNADPDPELKNKPGFLPFKSVMYLLLGYVQVRYSTFCEYKV